jgi:hypothetical protein
MCSVERTGAVVGGQNLENSLLFSLLPGNLDGEELAPDYLLRHTVRSAEKSAWIALEIAGNGRNFAKFASNRTGEGVLPEALA